MITELRRIVGQAEYQDWLNRQVIEGVFQEHRNLLISAYCAAIRLHYELQERNRIFPKSKPLSYSLPRRPEWYSAAVQILECAPEYIQRWFLSLSEVEKDACVQAVLRDGGVVTETGFFAELSPL